MATGLPAGRVPRHYNLRSSDAEEVNGEFDECGFVRIAPGAARPGDILLTRPGAGQLHVVILTPEGYLHADARLRRVADVPGPVPWPVLSAWRYPDEEALSPPPPPPPGRLV